MIATGRPLLDLLIEDKEIARHMTRDEPANHLGVAFELVDRVPAMRSDRSVVIAGA